MMMRLQPQQRFDGSNAGPSPCVLLLVDWINPLDREGADALVEPALAAAQVTARLKSRLVPMGVQCIYANDNYGLWRSDFRDLVAGCAQRGGASATISDLLAPRSSDMAVVKPRHSAFYETPLQLLLQQLETREIVLSGLASEWCVLFTAMDAYERGYSVWVPQDCIASESRERHAAAVRYMKDVLRVKVDAAEPVPPGRQTAARPASSVPGRPPATRGQASRGAGLR